MDRNIIEKFTTLWEKFFGQSELPITFFYSNDSCESEREHHGKGGHCMVATLTKVRRGANISFDGESLNCFGGRRYLGFADNISPRFDYFLSDGSDGGVCEKYKQSPQLVNELMKTIPRLPIKGENIRFKRWDKLEKEDSPEVVIFFATPDILSGLFTLARFDNNDTESVVAPFGSGCASIIYHPYMDYIEGRNRATIGMFDPSARICVKENIMTFAMPISMLLRMMDNMEQSFLTTDSWAMIQKRIAK